MKINEKLSQLVEDYFVFGEKDFKEIVKEIVFRLDNFEYDNIADTINDTVIYYDDQWIVMKHYFRCNIENANYFDALSKLFDDITYMLDSYEEVK